jgi:hypothetical protein
MPESRDLPHSRSAIVARTGMPTCDPVCLPFGTAPAQPGCAAHPTRARSGPQWPEAEPTDTLIPHAAVTMRWTVMADTPNSAAIVRSGPARAAGAIAPDPLPFPGVRGVRFAPVAVAWQSPRLRAHFAGAALAWRWSPRSTERHRGRCRTSPGTAPCMIAIRRLRPYFKFEAHGNAQNISAKKRSSGFRPVQGAENRENEGSGGTVREDLSEKN